MSLTVLQNSGPLGRDYLDDLRASALVALDGCADGAVPTAVLNYVRALEGEYLERRHRESRHSLDELWRPRTSRFSEGDRFD